VHMDELRRTVEKLAEVNALRASRIAYRDRQILEAIAGGATWVQVQQVTGLSPRGLALAIKRAKAQ
jgi:ribosomal protein S18